MKTIAQFFSFSSSLVENVKLCECEGKSSLSNSVSDEWTLREWKRASSLLELYSFAHCSKCGYGPDRSEYIQPPTEPCPSPARNCHLAGSVSESTKDLPQGDPATPTFKWLWSSLSGSSQGIDCGAVASPWVCLSFLSFVHLTQNFSGYTDQVRL